MTDSLYRTLLVDPSADHEIIRAAYRVLARRYHPDLTAEPDASRRMVEVNQAYAILRDPIKRREYDRRRETNAPTPPSAPPSQTTPPAAVHISPFADRAQRMAQQQGKTAPIGPGPLDFGRYQGWTLTQIARTDPDYLRWLQRHSSGIRFRQAIDDTLREKATVTPLRRAG